MVKFTNNIDELLYEIINNYRLIIIFHKNCQQSIELMNYAFGTDYKIIFVNKNIYLNINSDKLDTFYFDYFVFSKYYNKYHEIKPLKNLSFLNDKNIRAITEIPKIYFIENYNLVLYENNILNFFSMSSLNYYNDDIEEIKKAKIYI